MQFLLTNRVAFALAIILGELTAACVGFVAGRWSAEEPAEVLSCHDKAARSSDTCLGTEGASLSTCASYYMVMLAGCEHAEVGISLDGPSALSL